MSKLKDPGAWLVRVLLMEFSNKEGCIVHFGHGQPISFFVSSFIPGPTNQVEHQARVSLVSLGVKDFGDLVFDFAINFDRWWWWLHAPGDLVGMCNLELGDVEHRVD